MRLILEEKNRQFKREIELIFNLFKKEEDELLFSDTIKNGIFVLIEYHINHDKIITTGKAYLNNKTIIKQKERVLANPENDLKRKTVQTIKFVWLKIIEEIYEETHDWGILTGIRPTKLYHKLLQTSNHQQVIEELQKNYSVSKNKSSLLKRIVKKQLEVIPDLYKVDNEISLYIGIPFCPTKCAYCTFPAYGINAHRNVVNGFIRGLLKEIELIGKWIAENNRKVTTVYFGGGTPTSIEANELELILNNLANWVDLKNVREITVEAGRPDTITEEKLQLMNHWKIDRISINPQTFSQKTLDIIGRGHTVEETINKFYLARQYIDNINMDLIIGLPGENILNLENSLNQIEILQPESLTIHTMAFKRASYLTKNKNEFAITEQGEIKKMISYSYKWSQEHNYYPYYLYRQKNILGNLENIGYSKDGSESLYNILIMEEKQTIIGLGSGAVSKLIPPDSDQVYRLPNPKDPKVYNDKVEEITLKKITKLNENFKNYP